MGRSKEMCALETRTNFFPFKKSPKPGCILNSGAYYIREYTVLQDDKSEVYHCEIYVLGFYDIVIL